MSTLNTYTIERKGNRCAVIAGDATEFLSLTEKTRPLWNLILVSVIGLFVFSLTIMPAFFFWTLIFDPKGPTFLWHGFATFTTAIFAGVFCGSLAMRPHTYDVISAGCQLRLRRENKAYSLLRPDGTTLATLRTSKYAWQRRQWQANDPSGSVIGVAAETNVVPRPIRNVLRFLLTLVLLIGLFAGLYFVLVFVVAVGLHVALLATQICAAGLLWMAGFSNTLESTVRVSVGQRTVARISNEFGRTTLQVHEAHQGDEPQHVLLWTLLATLVYA